MTVMVTEIYDALRDAQGVSDDKARKAAEAVAAFEHRFVSIERKLDETRVSVERRIDDTKASLDRRIDETRTSLDRRIDDTKAELKLDIADVKGSLRVMQWMLGTLVAGVAALLVKAFA